MIRQAKAPFIVALNKIDKPDSDVDIVKEQLKEEGVLLEEHGGEVQCVPISAKQVKISYFFLKDLYIWFQQNYLAGLPLTFLLVKIFIYRIFESWKEIEVAGFVVFSQMIFFHF